MTIGAQRIFWYFLLCLLLVGCEVRGNAGGLELVNAASEVSPRFRELYALLGDKAVNGPAISPAWSEAGRDYQYTEAGLMVYDPFLPDGQRLALAPLGRELGLPTLPAGQTFQPDALFLSMYEKLGGARICGRALTGLKYNPILHRYEQYFENLGLYRMEGAEAGQVKLLAYGSWKCGAACPNEPAPEGRLWTAGPVQALFAAALAHLGPDLAGFAITQPFVASDGRIEQIFENVAIALDSASPLGFVLRSLPEKLGQIPGALEAEIKHPDYRFYAIDGAYGFNVPVLFVEYIDAHGRFEAGGPPMSAAIQQSGGGLLQCFAAYCLETRPGTQAAAPQPLGYLYKELQGVPTGATQSPAAKPQQEVGLQVSERYPSLSSQQNQEVVVVVTLDGIALKDAQTILTVALPDGDQEFLMPLTDSAGQAFLVLPRIEAPNSTLVAYQVCLEHQSGGKFCVRNDFLIWNNP